MEIKKKMVQKFRIVKKKLEDTWSKVIENRSLSRKSNMAGSWTRRSRKDNNFEKTSTKITPENTDIFIEVLSIFQKFSEVLWKRSVDYNNN